MPILKRVTESEDIDLVAALAHEIWTEHFTPIIGRAQVDYMLDRLQSAPAIARQLRDARYEYYLLREQAETVGYFARVPDEQGSSMQLSKLYLRQVHRGRGLGRFVINCIEAHCKARGIETIWLTVNRNNVDSIAFYQHVGFEIDQPIVTDIGAGFVMDDYRMVKTPPLGGQTIVHTDR